jgi:hypothetical protein
MVLDGGYGWGEWAFAGAGAGAGALLVTLGHCSVIAQMIWLQAISKYKNLDGFVNAGWTGGRVIPMYTFYES